MELISNFVWLIAALSLIGFTYRGVRAGSVRLSMLSAITLALLLCFILLPVISVSDDLLAVRQATLPESEQNWRLASHEAAVGLDLVLAVAAYLLLLLALRPETSHVYQERRVLRRMAELLTRSQRLRPPPSLA